MNSSNELLRVYFRHLAEPFAIPLLLRTAAYFLNNELRNVQCNLGILSGR